MGACGGFAAVEGSLLPLGGGGGDAEALGKAHILGRAGAWCEGLWGEVGVLMLYFGVGGWGATGACGVEPTK